MTSFTRGGIGAIRKALHRLDEDIERARQALAAGNVAAAKAALNDAVNAKVEALFFFPAVIVNERENIPFIELFGLFESIYRLIIVLRDWPRGKPYGEPDTIDELIRQLREKLAELERLRAKSWIEGADGTDPADYLERLIGLLRRYIAAAEAIQGGETPEMPAAEKDWIMLFLDLVGDEDPLGAYYIQLENVDRSIDRAKWEMSHEALPGNVLRSLDLAESNKHHFLAALLRIRIIEKPIGPGAEDLPPIPPDHA